MAYNGERAVITLGEIGLLTDVAPGQVPRGALIRANNVSFETGLLTKAPGSLRYNEQVLPAGVVALIDWWPDVVTQRLIAACSDGAIYRDIGDRQFSAAAPIASGLGTLDPRAMFVEGGQETSLADKLLFFFSAGSAQLKVLEGDGTSFANVSAPALDWATPNYPTFGFIHRNRLWAFMKQRGYASDTADHQNFTSNFLAYNIFPGEGGDLIGGHVFKGRAFVFKEGGFVYYLDDEDPDSDNWVWRKLASNFGLASPHGIVEVLNDMIAVNESGSPVSYNAVNALGDIESGDVLRALQVENYFRDTTSMNGLSVMHSVYYEARKQAFFTYRTGARPTNNTLLVLDFNRERPRVAFWTKDQADCLALRKDSLKIQKPIYGGADGYVYLMDREDRLVGGQAYTGEFKIGHQDFRYMDEKIAQRTKLFDNLTVEFIPQGTWNLSIDVYIDGDFSETVTVPMDIRDDGLDEFTLDTDLLGREETQSVTVPLHGAGKRISLHCYAAGANQNFAIATLTVGFRVSGTQETKLY